MALWRLFLGVKMRKRQLKIICSLLLIISAISFTSVGNFAFAANSNFENIDVMDDLKNAVDIDKYPADAKGKLGILNFVEYCYAYEYMYRGNYSLYVYIYNPALINVNLNSGQNKIQMATKFNADGKPVDYEKFDIKFCSASDDKRFIKYKIIDHVAADGTTFAKRISPDAPRNYYITGVELLTQNDYNATEYNCGGNYVFTGFAESLGKDKNAESTLNCTVNEIETLDLDAHHTTYRTNVSAAGKGHYNQISTVYFSVPQSVIDYYGFLYSIKAEWWEYKTQKMIVTSNNDFYNKFLPYTKKDVGGDYNANIPFRLWYGWNEVTHSGPPSDIRTTYDWSYNIDNFAKSGFMWSERCQSKEMSTILPYIFYSEGSIDFDKVFNFLATVKVAGDVKSNVVSDYIYNYKNNLKNGYIDCNGRQISSDLFVDYLDDEREKKGYKKGYNAKEVVFNEELNLTSYSDNHNWWNSLWDFGFSWPWNYKETYPEYNGYMPIQAITSDDLLSTNAEVAKNLLVNENDVSDLRKYCKKEEANDNVVYLFRFANTDYFAHECGHSNYKNTDEGVGEEDADTYIAQQTIFLDYDTIWLKFSKDGVYHVIPAVSSPIDVIGPLQPPQHTKIDIWRLIKFIIIAVLIILAIIIFWPVIWAGIKWIVTLPVKIINAIKKE